jgi:uncharacterized protein YvpB
MSRTKEICLKFNDTVIHRTENIKRVPFGLVTDIYGYTGNIWRNSINIQYSTIMVIFPFHTYGYASLV